MINKQLLKKRFSKHAKTYDDYAHVQKTMARQLIASLPQHLVEQQINILEIGCGSGYLTQLLCKAFPKARILAIDLAPGMIDVAQERIQEERVTFLCGDIEEIVLTGSYDLILSNATFQWLNHPSRVIQRLFTLLKPDGIFAFSTFGAKTFQELHAAYEQAKEKLGLQLSSSPGQSFYSLEELDTLCKQVLNSANSCSFEISKTEQLELEYFPSTRAFFNSIQKIGASNSNQEHSCQRPSFLRELMSLYETHYRDEKGVRATYHCLFITIVKGT
jgi:malonyl-CoA O-methyltransferase